MRWVMTRVLPEPGPARMRSGPSTSSTACRCASFSAERRSTVIGMWSIPDGLEGIRDAPDRLRLDADGELRGGDGDDLRLRAPSRQVSSGILRYAFPSKRARAGAGAARAGAAGAGAPDRAVRRAAPAATRGARGPARRADRHDPV